MAGRSLAASEERQPPISRFAGRERTGQDAARTGVLSLVVKNEDPPSEGAPEGYWPDAFDSDSSSLDVNPRFPDEDRPRPKIPWLWWGLRFLAGSHWPRGGRIDRELTEDELRQALRRGETPHCLIQLVHDQGRFNLGEFRQAAFHHVASEHLAFDPSELAKVQAAVRDTLVGWLSDGSIDGLPAVERRDALLMARALQPSGDSPVSLWSTRGGIGSPDGGLLRGVPVGTVVEYTFAQPEPARKWSDRESS